MSTAKIPKTLTFDALAKRVHAARIKSGSPALAQRAKRLVLSYLQTAQTHQMPVAAVVSEMASGQTAWRIGMALHDTLHDAPPAQLREAACATGCAFCCILTDPDGGVITRHEARTLHAALSDMSGQASGTDWHPKACAALDPDTRMCRAYDARPMICRSFVSTDASACEANANGGAEHGAGLLGPHLDYLAVQALCRQAVKGISVAPTYSLAKTTALGIAGEDWQPTEQAARQKTSSLDIALKTALRAAAA